MPRKLLLPLLLTLSIFVDTRAIPARSIVPLTQYVYICKGPYSKVYHRSPHCRGLANCSTDIQKITLDEAQKLGRRPCHIEYK